jgi:hypothetical protein
MAGQACMAYVAMQRTHEISSLATHAGACGGRRSGAVLQGLTWRRGGVGGGCAGAWRGGAARGQAQRRLPRPRQLLPAATSSQMSSAMGTAASSGGPGGKQGRVLEQEEDGEQIGTERER